MNLSPTQLRERCEAEEAALHAAMTDLVAQIDPPFSLLQKRRLARKIKEAEAIFARISLLGATFRLSGGAQARERQMFHRHHHLFPLWQKHLAHLRRMLRAKPQPLYSDPAEDASAALASLVAMDRLLERLHLGLSPHPPMLFPGESVMHGDIPLPMRQFQDHMQAASRVLRATGCAAPRFLDVGCGIGLKVMAAAEYFELAEGLEFDAALFATAQRLTGNATTIRQSAADVTTPWLMPTAGRTGLIFHADALQFSGYGDYDVIYAYRPIGDPGLRRELEARIVALARPEALLIMPYPEFCEQADDLGCVQIEGSIYLASGQGVDIDRLRERAGHAGHVRPDPPVGGYGDEGFVAPLAEFLRAWGQIG